MAKYYLYQFQTLKLISLFNLVPDNSTELLSELIKNENLSIKIVKSRKTKHGDFRSLRGGKFQITLNHIDNKFRFLITLIHELAHFKVSQSYKYRVSPHGFEWKKNYKFLMLPFLNNRIFPDDILKFLALHMINPPATTDSDTERTIKFFFFKFHLKIHLYFKKIKASSNYINEENDIFVKTS